MTMKQVKMQYAERGQKLLTPALVNASDEVEVSTLLHCKEILETPLKKTTLKELRFAVDIVECMAERGV